MTIRKIVPALALALVLVGCKTAHINLSPQVAYPEDMASSSLAAVLPDLQEVTEGNYALYIQPTDWDQEESDGTAFCRGNISETKITAKRDASFRKTLIDSFSSNFETIEVMTEKMSAAEVKAAGYLAQIIIDEMKLTSVFYYKRDNARAGADAANTTYLSGQLTLITSGGVLDQMDFDVEEEAIDPENSICGNPAPLGEKALAKAAKAGAIEAVTAAKALINNQRK